MKQLLRFIEGITNIGGYFSGWLVFLMMLIVLYEVFMRYALNQPPIIADEFAAYMLVAMSYLGAAYTWRARGHVRITALVSRLPTRVSSWLRLITLVFAFAFSLVLIQSSYVFLAQSFRFHRASSSWLNTPLQGPQMTLMIGFILLSLVLIVEIVKAIMNIRSGISVEGEAQ